MKSIFFFDVDTQRDMMSPKGALYVPGAERTIPKLRKLFEFARKHEVFVLSSADSHSAGDPEFQSLPPHCIAKSEGQLKIDDTRFPRAMVLENKPRDLNLLDAVKKNRQIVLEKQGFDPFDNPLTQRILRALPPYAIVFGVPFEFSVKATCLGLRKQGIKAAIVSDAVRSLSPQTFDDTCAELRKAGVEFITLDALLEIPAV